MYIVQCLIDNIYIHIDIDIAVAGMTVCHEAGVGVFTRTTVVHCIMLIDQNYNCIQHSCLLHNVN